MAPTEGGGASCWYQRCPRLSRSPQMVSLALRGLLGRAAGPLPVSQVGEARRGTVKVEDAVSARPPSLSSPEFPCSGFQRAGNSPLPLPPCPLSPPHLCAGGLPPARAPRELAPPKQVQLREARGGSGGKLSSHHSIIPGS